MKQIVKSFYVRSFSPIYVFMASRESVDQPEVTEIKFNVLNIQLQTVLPYTSEG
jgi:hypothetical protein